MAKVCPHQVDPESDVNIYEPCQICGALGPWFDGCKGNIVDTGDELHQVLGEALRRDVSTLGEPNG